MKVKRILRKIRNIILITLLTIITLVILVTVIIINSENAISKLALKEVSTMIKAPIAVENVTLRLFRNFPYATVEFSGFTIGKEEGSNPDSALMEVTDTLVRLRKLYVSVKTMPLLENKIEIKKVEVEGFMVNYFVDTAGVSNFDFIMAAEAFQSSDSLPVAEISPIDTTETILNVLLANLTVSDVVLNYNDKQMKAVAKIHIPKIHIAATVHGDTIVAQVTGGVDLSNCIFDEFNAHLMQKTSVNFDIAYDNGNINLKSMRLDTDGASIAATGAVVMGDSLYMNLGVDFVNVDIKELSKYAPADMMKEFGVVGVEGEIDINSKIKGYLYDTLLLPRVDAQISMKNGSVKTTEYPIINNIYLNGSVIVLNPNDLKTVSVDFNNVGFETMKSTFALSGKVSNIDKPVYNLNAKANLNLKEFTPFIPDSTIEYLSGLVTLNFSTHGQLPDDVGINSANYFLARTQMDVKVRNLSTALDSVNVIKNLSLDFNYKPNKTLSFTNVSLEAPEYNVALKPSTLVMQLVGNVADMDKLGINVEKFNFVLGETSMSGKATVKGFSKPEFTFETNARIDLDEIKHFIPDSLVEHISGKFDAKLTSYGTVDLDSIDNYIYPIVFEQSTLAMHVTDFNFEMFEDTLVRVRNLSTDFSMANDTMRIDNFYANMHGIEAWADSTEIWNMYKTFLLEQKDKQLIMKTHIKLSDIDYDMFAALMETDTLPKDSSALVPVHSENLVVLPETTQNGTSEAILTSKNTVSVIHENADSKLVVPDTAVAETYIPPFIVNGTVGVKSVKYGDIILTDLHTKFRVDDSLYVLDQFKFNGFGGSMISSVVYDTRQDSIVTVMFKNEINKLDIHKMLVDAKDFDQTEFTHENISGILTSNLEGRVVLQGDSIIYDKIMVMGSFKLENGGIYNYKPITDIGKFTNLRELENIVFKTMESGIFIYNNNIFFPKTDIVSSAIDMSAFGMASFGSDYEYHIKVHLGDVLLGKSDKLLKQQGKESDLFDETDTKERRGLNLLSMNRKGNSSNGFDNQRAQKVMTAEIKVQNRGLSLLFHPKLVNYSTELDRREIKKKKEEESDE